MHLKKSKVDIENIIKDCSIMRPETEKITPLYYKVLFIFYKK